MELGDAFRNIDRYYINWYQTKVTDGMGIQATALDTAPPEKADSVTYIARITNIPIETDIAVVNQKGEIIYQMFAGMARGLAAAWGGGKGTTTRETRSTPDQFAMLMMARSVSDKMLAGKAKTPEETEAMLNGLASRISIADAGRENLYTIAFQDPNGDLAKKVVQSLLTIFVEGSLGKTRQDISSSQRFIEEQLDAVDQEEAVRVRNAGAARD
jgi:hypothetical protein